MSAGLDGPNTEGAAAGALDPFAGVVRIADASLVDAAVSLEPDANRLFVSGSDFTRCRFTLKRLREVNFGQGETPSLYTECIFDGSSFRATVAGFARFERCSFRGVRIKYMIAQQTEFIDCTFSGSLKEATFWGLCPHNKPRRRNRFSGNDFTEADLIDCGFRGGVDLTQNLLPLGDGTLVALDGPSALRRAKARAERIEDRDLLDRVMGLIGAKEMSMGEGQQHLWMRRDDLSGVMGDRLAEANHVLFDLVREESRRLL